MIGQKPRCCPFLKGDNDMIQCTMPVTEYAFNNVCNHPNFGACKRYAGLMKKLKTPFQWLQYKAVETGGRTRTDQDKR